MDVFQKSPPSFPDIICGPRLLPYLWNLAPVACAVACNRTSSAQPSPLPATTPSPAMHAPLTSTAPSSACSRRRPRPRPRPEMDPLFLQSARLGCSAPAGDPSAADGDLHRHSTSQRLLHRDDVFPVQGHCRSSAKPCTSV